MHFVADNLFLLSIHTLQPKEGTETEWCQAAGEPTEKGQCYGRCDLTLDSLKTHPDPVAQAGVRGGPGCGDTLITVRTQLFLRPRRRNQSSSDTLLLKEPSFHEGKFLLFHL